jgi:DUF5010 C-terminal domain
MSLQLALDLPNQLTNASLGLITSVEARYARSLLATDPAGLSTGDLDSYYYNLGTLIRQAVAAPSTYSQEELARAVCFTKGLGTYSLGTDFDSGSLLWAQAVAPFFSSTFVFQAELFDQASVDSDVGNNGGLTGSWTLINPDVDVQQQVDGTINVGWTATGEWLQWNRPLAMANGTYSCLMRYSRGAGGRCTGNLNGITFDLPDTGSWDTFVVGSLPALVLGSSDTSIRMTFNQGFNLDYLQLTK